MKIIAITQARIGSSRLPGKVLRTINGKTLLQLHLERVAQSKLIDKIIVATTHEEGVEEIEEIAARLGHSTFKGSVDDVLDRFYSAAKTEMPDYIVRVTSDCPLIDAALIDEVINHCLSNKLDYCSNSLKPFYPDGMDAEIFNFASLERAWKEATSKSDREHVTPYIWRNSSYCGGDYFYSDNISYEKDYSAWRLTVDEEADMKVVENLVTALGSNKPWIKYIEYLIEHTDIKNINSHIKRNEGFII